MMSLELNRIYNEDCISGMERIPDSSIDVILTDPPYKYLNAKFDRDFDEEAFFKQANRVLKPDGWIILFGRGTSFYRWNTRLAEMGFSFKEEVVWDKVFSNSPVGNIKRMHETVSLHCHGHGCIRKSRVPYLEKKGVDMAALAQDVKRLKTALGNPEALARIERYLDSRGGEYTESYDNDGCTYHPGLHTRKREVDQMAAMTEGLVESDIIRISGRGGHIHPTQKPVRLLERLLNLVIAENSDGIVLDPFSGSGSTAIAAKNLGHNFIGFEIDKDYFDKSMLRLEESKRFDSLPCPKEKPRKQGQGSPGVTFQPK